jgi:acetoacetyl-CoA synthetase
MTHFGTSAKYIDALAKAACARPTPPPAGLRMVMSTGSPARRRASISSMKIKKDLLLASISGGTDIVSCFVLGNPTLPVWRGEIQGAGLGMAVDVFDDDGRPVPARRASWCAGCLFRHAGRVLERPDGAKYRAAYFERFPNVWCHGDFWSSPARRSSSTAAPTPLNPGACASAPPRSTARSRSCPVLEAVVIGQDWPPTDPSDVRVVLFVRLVDGLASTTH